MLKKSPVFFFKTCPSTMDTAKTLGKQGALQEKPFFVMTENQTHGRGRSGTTWVQSQSIPMVEQVESSHNDIPCTSQSAHYETFDHVMKELCSKNDTLPLTLSVPEKYLQIPMQWVSSLVGAAVYDALTNTQRFLINTLTEASILSHENLKLFLKWPNDLIWLEKQNFHKICGVLCESAVTGTTTHPILIGIGLNFFTHPEIPTSISFFEKIISNKKDRDKILTSKLRCIILEKFYTFLLHELEEYLMHKRSLEQLRDIVIERSLPLGTILSVNKGTQKGAFNGIDLSGALLLKNNSEPIFSSETDLVHEPIAENKAGILAIDLGNTRIHFSFKAGNINSQPIIANAIYDDVLNLNTTALKTELNPILKHALSENITEFNIAYISVNSDKITEQAIGKIKTFFTKEGFTFSKNILPMTEFDILDQLEDIKNNFDKRTLGADRAIKYYFAFIESKRIKRNVLVFSLGTAVTCEGTSPEGHIIENFIFPGIQMSFNALNHYTALLPKLKANPELFHPQNDFWNQEVYMQRGVFVSVAATILTTINIHAPCQVFLTGGNAEAIVHIINELKPLKSRKNDHIEIVKNLESNILVNHFETFTQSKKK